MDLKIDIYTKNMDLSDRVREYVEKKVGKLDRIVNNADEVRVDLASVKTARNASDRNVAQITIRGKKYILRTEERADDLLSAVDRAVEKMQRQITRYKEKHQRGRGDGRPASEVVPVPESEVTIGDEEPIVRRKKFVLTPMDEMEAIEQMKLLGHEDFFLFYNATTNAINVLYMRRNGTYGLIEPTIG